jgi:hypothetical protein
MQKGGTSWETPAAGETVVIGAGEERRITAPVAFRALVASRGGSSVTTAEGTRPLPWAE